jgi:uncharacterized protein YbaR (Trm112 family)
MNKPENYTPVGFKTKAVLEAQVKEQTQQILSTNEKIKTVAELNQIGQLICSPKFQQYPINDKINILNQFAELKNIVKTFK